MLLTMMMTGVRWVVVSTTPCDINGPRFAWREAGHGAPPLVLLHGLGGSRISWEPQLAALADRARVVAWDAPGYGAAPSLPGAVTFAALADAVVSLADELGADAFHLAGISFGGMIAQHLAIRHPARVLSLTLLATSPKFGLDGTSPDEWRAARLAPLDAGHEPVEFADRVLAGIAGPHITATARAGQRAAMARVTGDALRRSIDCLVTHDTRHLLGTIDVPTRVLVGALDEETPPDYSRQLAALIPQAQLDVIDGAGHLLNVEASDAVNAALAEQLAVRS